MSNIQNIIFDLGGVIYDIDYTKTTQAFVELGANPQAVYYSQSNQTNIFNQLECGEISSNDFVLFLKKHLADDVSQDAILEAWNAMLIGQPFYRIEMLISLKQKFKLVLLSNTNEIHINAINQELENKFNTPNYNAFFDRVFLSHEIKMRKPHIETFQYVLNSMNLNPEETLFIDDSIQHIEGAKSAGICTFHHTKGDIVNVIQNII